RIPPTPFANRRAFLLTRRPIPFPNTARSGALCLPGTVSPRAREISRDERRPNQMPPDRHPIARQGSENQLHAPKEGLEMLRQSAALYQHSEGLVEDPLCHKERSRCKCCFWFYPKQSATHRSLHEPGHEQIGRSSLRYR